MLNNRAFAPPVQITLSVLFAAVLSACGGAATDSGASADALAAGSVDASQLVQIAAANRKRTLPPVPVTEPAPAPAPAPAAAPASGTAALAWAAPQSAADGSALSGLAGYRIYYGTAHGSYPQMVAVSGASTVSYTIQNLTTGTYYLIVTSVDSNNNESAPSPEVTKTVV